MKDVFQILAAFGFCISALVALPSWFAGLYYMHRTANASIHGSAIWRRAPGILGFFRFHPLNVVLDASKLTPQGRIYRHRMIIADLLIIIPICLSLLFAALGGML